MAKTAKLLSFRSLVAFLHLVIIFESAKSNGLSIKLIHRHSPNSPFYPGDITMDERMRLLSSSVSLGIKTNHSNHTISTKTIRPKMGFMRGLYLVRVGIGTFAARRPPYYNYFLNLDTADELIWTQCEQCQGTDHGTCYRQAAPLFPASKSQTYYPLPCNRHPLCYPGLCINNTCSYSKHFEDGATTAGYLASESFTFNSGKKQFETITNLVFGCGIKNQGFMESSENNLVAGSFGLGPGERSLLRQKWDLTLGRFSYCLPPWDVAHNSTVFLRFGADIPQREGLKVTPLMTIRDEYFVNLKGISVGDEKLDIPEKMFARKNNSHGGCVVDSGATITYLPEPIYKKLKEMLTENYFSGFRKTTKQGIFDLCYLFPLNARQKDLPDIIFHLQDADLVFPPKVGFPYGRTTSGKRFFCLGVVTKNAVTETIIGAFQQANKRFIFDIAEHKLYFGSEDCTRGA